MPTASSARAARPSTSSPRPSSAAWAAPSCSPSSTRTTTSTGASRASRRATGDFRLKAVPERIVQLAGQPAFAWAPGQLWTQEGPRWEHCYRAALERTSSSAPRASATSSRPGSSSSGSSARTPTSRSPPTTGPVYSPNAMLDVSEFLSELLGDLDANGLGIGQIHAEYGWSQLELSLDADGSARRRPTTSCSRARRSAPPRAPTTCARRSRR